MMPTEKKQNHHFRGKMKMKIMPLSLLCFDNLKSRFYSFVLFCSLDSWHLKRETQEGLVRQRSEGPAKGSSLQSWVEEGGQNNDGIPVVCWPKRTSHHDAKRAQVRCTSSVQMREWKRSQEVSQEVCHELFPNRVRNCLTEKSEGYCGQRRQIVQNKFWVKPGCLENFRAWEDVGDMEAEGKQIPRCLSQMSVRTVTATPQTRFTRQKWAQSEWT